MIQWEACLSETEAFHDYATFDPLKVKRRPKRLRTNEASAYVDLSDEQLVDRLNRTTLDKDEREFETKEDFLVQEIFKSILELSIKKDRVFWETVKKLRILIRRLNADSESRKKLGKKRQKDFESSEKNVPQAVLLMLVEVFRSLLERDVHRANKAFLDMTVGNHLWPMGGINLGVVQTVERKVAIKRNELDDETVQSYLQCVKRVITNRGNKF